MHVPAGHSLPDATGVAFALMAWARHRCLQLYLLLFFFFFFFSKMNRIFEGLNMLEKSWNFAHASDLVKIYVWYRFQKRVWQNGSTAPPIVKKSTALELRFTYMHENWHTYVKHQYLQKRLLEQYPKPNRKSVIFNFMSKFCIIFVICMPCILTNSS